MSQQHPQDEPQDRSGGAGGPEPHSPGYLYGPPGSQQAGDPGASGHSAPPPGYGQQPPPGYGHQPPPPGYGHQPPPPGYGYQPPPQGWAPPYGQPAPGAPYGFDPYGRPYSDRTKLISGLLQIFVGYVGAGRWYTGHYGMAVAQLATCGGFGVWSLIDGIYLLASSQVTDASGRPLRTGA